MATLIPHGTTPTGFGIRQRRNGCLRPTSKCCGRTMEVLNNEVRCRGCGTDYRSESHRLGASLSNDIRLSKSPGPSTIVEFWVQAVTGYEDAQVTVTW